MSKKRSRKPKAEPRPRKAGRHRALAAALLLLVAMGVWLSMWPSDTSREAVVERTTKPNVLLVVIDTLRADRLGIYGGTSPTPAIDALARRGVLFRHAVSHVPLTLPAHTSIFTASYPVDHDVRANGLFRLGDDETTLAEVLNRAGYRTGAFVGSFVLDSRFGLAQGFEHYDDRLQSSGVQDEDFDVSQRRAEEVLRRARSWIEQTDDRPWFTFVHLFDPHAPYAPPTPFRERYRDDPYQGEIAYVDDVLGRFMEGIPEDALIVLTADHGEGLGEHGEATHGMFAYESTLRVPLVMTWPGRLPANQEVAGRVRHVDIAPTIVDLAGITWTDEIRGASLLPLIESRDEDVPERESYFESLSYSLERGSAPLFGMYRDRFKYVQLPVPELYDLQEDPAEARDLSAERPRLRDEMAEEVRRLAARADASDTAPVDDDSRRRLRSLGYLGEAVRAKTEYTVDDDPKRLIEVNTKLDEALDAQRAGRADEAIRLFREVIDERPTYGSAYKFLAYTLHEAGDLASSISALRAAIEEGVGTPAIASQLGAYLLEDGRPGEAIEVLSESTASLADHVDSLQSLSIALAQTGKTDDAVRVAERALALSPGSASLTANLGTLLFQAGRVEEAEARLVGALDIDADLPSAWNVLGALQHGSGRIDDAIVSWKRAVELDESQYEAMYNLGVVLTQSERPGEATEYLTRFVRTAPPNRYGRDLEDARWLLGELATLR